SWAWAVRWRRRSHSSPASSPAATTTVPTTAPSQRLPLVVIRSSPRAGSRPVSSSYRAARTAATAWPDLSLTRRGAWAYNQVQMACPRKTPLRNRRTAGDSRIRLIWRHPMRGFRLAAGALAVGLLAWTGAARAQDADTVRLKLGGDDAAVQTLVDEE